MADRISNEVQDALERGFAKLMSLEARLQRVRRGAEPGVVEELVEEIRALRKALADLRTRMPAASPLSGGFVLPR